MAAVSKGACWFAQPYTPSATLPCSLSTHITHTTHTQSYSGLLTHAKKAVLGTYWLASKTPRVLETKLLLQEKTSKSKGMTGISSCLHDTFILSRKWNQDNTDSCWSSCRRPEAHSPSKWQVLLLPPPTQQHAGCHLKPCLALFPSSADTRWQPGWCSA